MYYFPRSIRRTAEPGIRSSNIPRLEERNVLNIEKTIAGAQKYCKYHTLLKNLVIKVGSNDLDKKTTNTCISEMKNLLSDLVANHIGTTVHVLPAFERVHNDTLIQRLTTSTKKLRITALVQKTLNL